MLKISFEVERVYFEIDEDKLEQWEKPQIKESKKAFFYATIRYYNTLIILLCYHQVLQYKFLQ